MGRSGSAGGATIQRASDAGVAAEPVPDTQAGPVAIPEAAGIDGTAALADAPLDLDALLRPPGWWRRHLPVTLALLALLAVLGVVAAPPALASAWLWLGDRALAEGQFGDAAHAYEQADWVRPGQVTPPLRLGEVELARHRAEAASGWFRAAAAREPDAAAAPLGLARAALLADDADAGVRAAGAAVSAARAPADAALARWVLAQAQLAAHDAIAAEVALAEAVKLADGLAAPPPWRTEALLKLGLLQARHDLTAAEATLDRAARLGGAAGEPARTALGDVTAAAALSDDAARDADLGELLVRHDLAWLALEPLARAAANRPDDTRTQVLLGAARLQLRDFAGAAAALERAEAAEPEAEPPYLLLGIARRELNDLSASATALRRARELDGHDPAAPRELAQTYVRAGAWPAAEEMLVAALALEPNRLGAHLDLVRFHLDHLYGLDRGLERARAAVALDPRSAEAADLLGWALHLNGQDPAARDALRGALSLNSTLPAAHYHLAVVLAQRGDLGGARAAYQAAADLDTTGRYLNLARAGLANLPGAR